MTEYLVDTNTISEMIKPAPAAEVVAWCDQADPGELFVSVITFGEIRAGIEKLAYGRRRTQLESWFSGSDLSGQVSRSNPPCWPLCRVLVTA